MYRATLVNLRKNEALVLALMLHGKPHSVLVTPGESVPAIADTFSTVQIGSLVARHWLRMDQVIEVIENHADAS